MNKKEQELLKELFPIIIKYDMATIENCIDYIKINQEQLSVCLDFANGKKTEVGKRSKSAIDKFLLTINKEKSLVIKRVCKYLSGANFTAEQMHSIFRQYFESKQISTNIISTDKEGTSLEIAKFLANLNIEQITEFERNVQMSNLNKNANENSLENWSKLIVKK